MKRIIVEGIDGSGKTSIIQTMVARLPGLITVVDGFKHNPYGFTDYNDWLSYEFGIERGAGRVVPVHDRFFYSEIVYGEIFRGGISIEPRLYLKVIEELRKSALLIYCRPPLSVVKETVTDNPQMEGVLDNLGKLYDSYEQLMSEESELYGSRFVMWDMTRHYWINYLNPVIRRYLRG